MSNANIPNSEGVYIRFDGPVPGGTPGGPGPPDPLPNVFFGTMSMTVARQAATIALPVRLSAVHTVPVRVTVLNTTPVGAGFLLLGTDYAVPSTTVTIPAGSLEADFLVEVLAGAVVDVDEVATFALNAAVETLGGLRPVQIIAPTTASLTVEADEVVPLPTVQWDASLIIVRENESGNARIVMSEPRTEPTYIEIVFDSGSALPVVDFTFPAFRTIPAGETSVLVPIAVLEDAIDESPGERANLRIAQADGAAVGTNSVLVLVIPEEAPAAFVNPVIGWRQRFFNVTDGATNRVAAVEIAILNPPPFAVFAPVVVDVTVHASSTATFGTDYALSTQQVTLTAAVPSAQVVISAVQDAVLEGQETIRLDVSIASGGPATVDPAFTTLVGTINDGNAPQGLSAPIAVEPVGSDVLSPGSGSTGPGLVWVPMPLATPIASVGELEVNINGYGCDVFPMAWDPESGDIDQVMLVALAPNPTGRASLPGANGTTPLEVTLGASLMAEAPVLKALDLSGYYLELRPSYNPGHAFRAWLGREPESGVNPTLLEEVVELDGARVRRRRMLLEFHRDGTDGSARNDRMLLAYVWVEERADHRCVNLEVAIINGKVSRLDSPYTTVTTGDGPVYFDTLGLYGLDGNPGHDAVLFQDRPLNHFREGNVIWLAQRPDSNPTEVNRLNPGQWFPRRLALFDRDEVAVQTARDIRNGKGKGGYAVGDIGFYGTGKWMGAAHLPDFAAFPPLNGLHANAYGALMVQGYAEAAIMRDDIANRPLRYNPDGIKHCGWLKPWGEPNTGQGGQNDSNYTGGELAGSAGYLQTLMLRCDGYVERQGLAHVCLETGEPMTLDDFTLQTAGELPYAFSPIGTVQFFHIAHNRYPALVDRDTYGPRQVDELAPTSLPWNVIGEVESRCSFEAFYNTQHAPQGIWGPQKKTHLNRFFAQTTPLYQLAMDPIAGLALRFESFSSLCSVPHIAIKADRPWRRHDFAVGHGNLPYIIASSLPASTAGQGYWATPGDNRGRYSSHTPRIICQVMAAVMWQLYHGTAEERMAIDRNGDTTSWCTLAGTCLNHVIGGNGLASSMDDTSVPQTYREEFPPNFGTRLGSVPHPDLHGGTAWWPISQTRMNAYWALVYPLLQRALQRNVTRGAWLDNAFYHLDTIDKASEVHRPDAGMIYPTFMHISEGVAGHGNAAMTIAAARAGAGVWFFLPDVQNPGLTFYPDRAPESVPMQAWLQWYRFGAWGDVKRLLKRQVVETPSTMSDGELMRSLWASVHEVINNAGRRHEVRGYIPTLAALQRSGVAYPVDANGAPLMANPASIVTFTPFRGGAMSYILLPDFDQGNNTPSPPPF